MACTPFIARLVTTWLELRLVRPHQDWLRRLHGLDLDILLLRQGRQHAERRRSPRDGDRRGRSGIPGAAHSPAAGARWPSCGPTGRGSRSAFAFASAPVTSPEAMRRARTPDDAERRPELKCCNAGSRAGRWSAADRRAVAARVPPPVRLRRSAPARCRPARHGGRSGSVARLRLSPSARSDSGSCWRGVPPATCRSRHRQEAAQHDDRHPDGGLAHVGAAQEASVARREATHRPRSPPASPPSGARNGTYEYLHLGAGGIGKIAPGQVLAQSGRGQLRLARSAGRSSSHRKTISRYGWPGSSTRPAARRPAAPLLHPHGSRRLPDDPGDAPLLLHAHGEEIGTPVLLHPAVGHEREDGEATARPAVIPCC